MACISKYTLEMCNKKGPCKFSFEPHRCSYYTVIPLWTGPWMQTHWVIAILSCTGTLTKIPLSGIYLN